MSKDVKIRGEFGYRLLKNFMRLQEEEYRPEFIFQQTRNGYSWPGDWEGRTLLALVLLRRVTGAEPSYLEELIVGLHAMLKENGYLGENAFENGKINEQQLSGHNWLLRGLLELSIDDNRQIVQDMISNMIEKLYLPISGAYYDYPLDKGRTYDGNAIGEIQEETVNNWLLSTDIGCAYMSLDALSQYYQMYHDERIFPLLEEMADTFMMIDFVGASVQTHASLSATRGVLRLYQATGKKKYIEFARTFFELYCANGMTENYGNYNWFQRPAWTETCAIVDSYMLAVELFKHLKEKKYIDIANKILYNALGYAQRSNGGFGCDKCSVADGENELLYVQQEHYEASWCCSMRGAEGLSYAAENMFWQDENSGFFINYLPGVFKFGSVQFEVDTDFPYEGNVVIRFRQCPKDYKLNFFVPEHTEIEKMKILVNGQPAMVGEENGFLVLYIDKPCVVELNIPLHMHLEDTIKKSSKKSCWYGVLQLGCLENEEVCLENIEEFRHHKQHCFIFDNQILFPINQNIYNSRENVLERKVRILF